MKDFSSKNRQVLLGLAASLLTVIMGLSLWGCNTFGTRIAGTPEIGRFEADPAVFGEYYPLQYAAYLRNKEMISTAYGGSEPYDYLEKYPYLERIYEGIGFSIDYKRSRGHIYSLEDTLKTERGKPGGACLTCKSGDVPRLLDEYGVSFYAEDFETISAKSAYPISCVDCHAPETMELRISRPSLGKALERKGQDLEELTRDDYSSLVCAQCHVEYYFAPGTLEVTFPWDEGFKVDEVEQYFTKQEFTDWFHPTAGTKLVKIQHPEYEMYQGSVHQRLGVSCADCHMPVMEKDGETYPSHWWTSPVHHLEESCSSCHGNDMAALQQRVESVQETVYKLQNEVAYLLVDALDALDAAAKNGTDETVLEEARSLYRKAHIRWDWVFVENSTGFHNRSAATDSLEAAGQYARNVLKLLEKHNQD